MIDTYKTIKNSKGQILFKDKGSKFFGYAYPISNEEDVKLFIEKLKKEHHSARHWCYAWRIGEENIRFRANDDGEPNNSAGQPILGQLLSFDVTNVLLVVVRYFGGTKLGVGGLINAYKTTAKFTLEECTILEKTIDTHYRLVFDYIHMNKVMRIVKENKLKILHQKMELNCDFLIPVRKKNASKIKQLFLDLRCLKIKEI